MASRYTQISIEEMREAFSKKNAGGKGWVENIAGYSEIVFDFQISPVCTLRVWSSLSTNTDTSRDCGKDAIRVTAFDPRPGGKGIVKASRVYRVAGWKENLRKRINSVFYTAKERLAWVEKRNNDNH